MKKFTLLFIVLITTLIISACGDDSSSDDGGGTESDSTIEFGATVGPYSDMVNNAIAPLLEEKGYEVNNQEFTDYVQPNNVLANGEIDANLFQHKIYLDSFAEENNLDLSEVIIVPTAPMGLYSETYDSVDDIEEGSTLAIANDPTNLARTLIMLQDEGLITISDEIDALRADTTDIEENPLNLEITEVEAAQLPRLVESEDLSAVPGNYALDADLDLLDAIALEEMPDDYRNRVVVNTEDLEEEYVEDIVEVIESEEFEEIIDEEFEGFGKPDWMENR
ncbi:MetQ/NlpA family ABC transporter substrate-binding protein [Halalkalibacillus halophilus]|uniref:MetQ/NlpA family ABC transporter substrate-binding protein n=1 Tax=Halalkalibacillus halophilus TaxID=392827 RepID=UPI000416558C|nr:MetQ/NlpA family ABC transporter substrate-binding protein [Halalkalibacillus halophilus]